jgi:hypothetical protein
MKKEEGMSWNRNTLKPNDKVHSNRAATGDARGRRTSEACKDSKGSPCTLQPVRTPCNSLRHSCLK